MQVFRRRRRTFQTESQLLESEFVHHNEDNNVPLSIDGHLMSDKSCCISCQISVLF